MLLGITLMYTVLFIQVLDIGLAIKYDEPKRSILLKCLLVCIYFWISLGLTVYYVITGGN